MGSARTLRRRQQRKAAKHRPPRRPTPLTAGERWMVAEGLKVLLANLEMSRRMLRYNGSLCVQGAKFTVPIRLGRLPER